MCSGRSSPGPSPTIPRSEREPGGCRDRLRPGVVRLAAGRPFHHGHADHLTWHLVAGDARPEAGLEVVEGDLGAETGLDHRDHPLTPPRIGRAHHHVDDLGVVLQADSTSSGCTFSPPRLMHCEARPSTTIVPSTSTLARSPGTAHRPPGRSRPTWPDRGGSAGAHARRAPSARPSLIRAPPAARARRGRWCARPPATAPVRARRHPTGCCPPRRPPTDRGHRPPSRPTGAHRACAWSTAAGSRRRNRPP